MLDQYTDSQSQFAKAFHVSSCCCATYCECGRIYFVTSSGHGDYNTGELDGLMERAAKDPDKYIEVPDFSYVDSYMDDQGSHVIGCPCGYVDRIITWMEAHHRELAKYVELLANAKIEHHQRELLREYGNRKSATYAGWCDMSLAPKDTTLIEAMVEGSDKSVVVHYAQDYSGEFQPSFDGWFRKSGNSYVEVKPIKWRPLPKDEDHD